MKIIFATSNENKVKEVREILSCYDFDVKSLKDEGISIDIEENGKTFEENAIIKAKAIMNISNSIVIADDSGLEVDFINKEPGVYSARYLGEKTPQEEKNKSIIDRLKMAEESSRTARFVCAMACAFPDGRILTSRGEVEGIIAYKEEGDNGFGYDTILYVPEYKLTMAQMTSEQKNAISHRFKALKKIGKMINENINSK